MMTFENEYQPTTKPNMKFPMKVSLSQASKLPRFQACKSKVVSRLGYIHTYIIIALMIIEKKMTSFVHDLSGQFCAISKKAL